MNRTAVAVAAAVAFAVTGALELAHDQTNPFETATDYAIEASFVVALVCACAAQLAFAAMSGGRVAWRIAAAGHAVLAVAAGVTLVRGEESLDPLFPLGILAILGGTLALAILDARGRVTPTRAGLVLLAAWVATIPLDNSLVLAAGWFAVARLAGGLALRRVAAG